MKLILSLLFILSTMSLQAQAQTVNPGEPFIIVNKANNKLAFIDDNEVQEILPVGTGKTQELTPEGLFTVKVKAVNPYYRKKNIPGGDPRNPLGSRWIGFDARNTDGRIYGIHGTNQPDSIGKFISNGCVRMHKTDVERLYEKVPLGTKVLITKSNESFDTLARNIGAIK